jgi:hypothetical protein
LRCAALAIACAAPALGQPGCPPLPPPPPDAIHVFPAQAGELRAIVGGASPGTTILLHDGVYALDQGDAASRLDFATPGVTLRSFSGDRDAVVLDGDWVTHELVFVRASNVTIANLTVREAYDHPIHVTGGAATITGTRLHNLRVVDPGQQAIKINASGAAYADQGTIECSSIELTDAGRPHVRDSCYTGGVDAHAAWGWLVRRNRISGFWCPSGLSEHGVHFWSASRDTVVEENVIVDCARGVGFGLGATGAGRSYPDDPYPGVGYLGHVDGVIRNNFVAAADPDLLASDSGFDAGIAVEQARFVRVVHNTVVSTAAPFSSIEWRWENTQAGVTNNLVSHFLRPRDGAQANLAGNIQDAPTTWFRSVAEGDLHLRTGALPPVGAGAAVGPGLADGDLDLEPRTPPRDVGADEWSPLLFADGFESGGWSRWSQSQT